MSEEEQIAADEQTEEAAESRRTVTEEFQVQAEDLMQTINDIVREGTARRVTVIRNDRVLVDIPLVLGIGAGLVLAIYLPVISALVGVGALLTGCTVRVEREEPSEEV
jgi:hypothetical protein